MTAFFVSLLLFVKMKGHHKMQNEPVAVSFRTLIELYLKNDLNGHGEPESYRSDADSLRSLRQAQLAQADSELKIRTEVNAKVIADFLRS